MSGLEEARRRIAQERERKTGFLDLGNLGLEALPDELFELTELRGLSLGTWYLNENGRLHWPSSPHSYNRLPALPEKLARLTRLSRLFLVSQPVTTLEPITTLPALTALHCQGTRVSSLEPIAKFSALTDLDCSFTRITNLEPIAKLSALTNLNCSHTKVSTLEPAAKLSALAYLNCSYTDVANFEPIAKLSALTSLNCSRTPTSTLQLIAKLSTLTVLDCSRTKVSTLEPIAKLSALASLSCSDTPISTLAPIANLSALAVLDCSSTRISTLEPIAKLSALTTLYCSNTPISTLEPVAKLSALASLSFSSTPISTLEPIAKLSALTNLNFSDTPISTLEPIAKLSALTNLNCAGTPISTLEPIAKLSALASLDFSRTKVSTLEPIAKLSALTNLICSHTKVSTLEPIAKLSTLTGLDCSRTKVSTLEPIAKLSALRTLDCSDTPVPTLEPIAKLSTLTSLNCSSTPILGVDALRDLPSLTVLTAHDCALREFPKSLLFAPSLQILFLHGTAIPGIPREVLSSSPWDDCLERLRGHVRDLESGAEEVRATKVIALGNGRVGKTQICRRLRNLPFDPSVPSTHGITVTSEPWPGGAEGTLLNLWDFGGQDIYHGAHSLFMSTRAVFLVVWHPDFEERAEEEHYGVFVRNYPLPYWLEYVRTLAGADAPVLVVQSQCDRRELEVKRLPVEDRLLDAPSVKPCWYSAKNDRGRAALEEAIRDGAAELRERHGISTIGAGRARVVRALEALRREDQELERGERHHRTLSIEEFRTLCNEAKGVSSAESLLDYLHNAGVVFYRPGLFHDRIILDQSWALDAVYAVFERQNSYRQISGNRGRFTRSLLELLVWSEHSQAEQRLFLSLMESCDICFNARAEERRLGLETEYVAPDLLPEKAAVASELAGRWNDDAKARRLVYEYEFLHAGLARALISDAGKRAKEAGVYFKYGFWVHDRASGANALFEQQKIDERRGRIVLRVQGQRAGELATWMRERIDERNRQFGYSGLAPRVDDFANEPRHAPRGVTRKRRGAPPEIAPLPIEMAELSDGRELADERPPEPVFEKPPVAPKTQREVFVSYAWGDSTPEGRRREAVVDELCRSLGVQGVSVIRDREALLPGQRISEFMDRLASGDLVIVVVSEKYLKSWYCTYELFRIYQNCGNSPDRFIERIVPLVMPDANIAKLSDRLSYAEYWKNEKIETETLIARDPSIVGGEAFRKYVKIREFAHNVSDMLEHLVDKLMPRDLERMAAEGFREVLEIVTGPPKR